jgi:DNA-binding transcriptional MerR regulator
MFRIGDFSRFTRVSVKMLRHYDEIGLLRPAHVDRESGYRYYAADQLPRLNRIIALKDLGFSLDQIGALLAEDMPLEELRGMLRLRRAEVAERLRAEQLRLAQIEARLRQIEQEARPPHYDVVLRAAPAQLVASIRATVPSPGEPIARMFDALEQYAADRQVRAASSPLTIFHDAEYREEQIDVETAVPLSAPVLPHGRICVRELPAIPMMACVVYTGGYERMSEVLEALLRWVAANGYCAAGALREVYLRFGADHAGVLGLPQAFLADDPALFVTEVQLPVAIE